MIPSGNEPIILLGAARSGTKLLRSVLASAGGVRVVPHDVNYVWRTLLPNHPNDAIPEGIATEASAARVHRLLDRLAGRRPGEPARLLEKTVSNTLRVPLVASVFPDAQFVHLVRDGRSVTESAQRCWRAPPEVGRLIAKARTFPLRSCPGYAIRFARGLIGRCLGGERRLPVWGPHYPGIEHDLETMSLAEVCAWQWRHSVEQTRRGLTAIPADRRIEVRYESLVSDPVATARRLASFLGYPAGAAEEFAVANVTRGPQRSLERDDAERTARILAPALAELGYSSSALGNAA